MVSGDRRFVADWGCFEKERCTVKVIAEPKGKELWAALRKRGQRSDLSTRYGIHRLALFRLVIRFQVLRFELVGRGFGFQPASSGE